MDKTFLIVIAVIILLGGIFAFIYFKYEKPAEEAVPDTHDLNIRILVGDQQISEPFTIIMNGQLLKEYTSLSDSYVSVKIPSNNTYSIYTESEKYYNIKEDFNTFGLDKSIRKDIILQPYGNITINLTQTLIDKEVFIDITSNGTIKAPILCMRWSKNIIAISLFNMSRVEVPKRFENKVDHCYKIGDEIKDKTERYSLTFKQFGNIDESDYIKTYLIDADTHYFGGLMSEDSSGNDIGIKDIYFEIK